MKRMGHLAIIASFTLLALTCTGCAREKIARGYVLSLYPGATLLKEIKEGAVSYYFLCHRGRVLYISIHRVVPVNIVQRFVLAPEYVR